MSSLVVGDQGSTTLVLFNGGLLTVQAIAKSAVVAGTLVLTSAQNDIQALVTVGGTVNPITQAYGSYAAGDLVWTVQANQEVQALGVDQQPVLLTPVLGSALVP